MVSDKKFLRLSSGSGEGEIKGIGRGTVKMATMAKFSIGLFVVVCLVVGKLSL